MSYPNLDLLESAAAKLHPLLPETVFVGGCATGLLINDPGAPAVRGTYDVDVITEIASYADYVVFSDRLRKLGFLEDSREGAPLCRWQHSELVLHVMPLDAKIIGFSTRWYADALRSLPLMFSFPAGSLAGRSRHLTSSLPSSKPFAGADRETILQVTTSKTS
jgi:hypothetical protein